MAVSEGSDTAVQSPANESVYEPNMRGMCDQDWTLDTQSNGIS